MNSKALTVLYDSSATYSFISLDCVNKLQLPVSQLPYDLLVSTPTDRPIRASQVCMKLHFRIDDKIFVADLV